MIEMVMAMVVMVEVLAYGKCGFDGSGGDNSSYCKGGGGGGGKNYNILFLKNIESNDLFHFFLEIVKANSKK